MTQRTHTTPDEQRPRIDLLTVTAASLREALEEGDYTFGLYPTGTGGTAYVGRRHYEGIVTALPSEPRRLTIALRNSWSDVSDEMFWDQLGNRTGTGDRLMGTCIPGGETRWEMLVGQERRRTDTSPVARDIISTVRSIAAEQPVTHVAAGDWLTYEALPYAPRIDNGRSCDIWLGPLIVNRPDFEHTSEQYQCAADEVKIWCGANLVARHYIDPKLAVGELPIYQALRADGMGIEQAQHAAKLLPV